MNCLRAIRTRCFFVPPPWLTSFSGLFLLPVEEAQPSSIIQTIVAPLFLRALFSDSCFVFFIAPPGFSLLGWSSPLPSISKARSWYYRRDLVRCLFDHITYFPGFFSGHEPSSLSSHFSIFASPRTWFLTLGLPPRIGPLSFRVCFFSCSCVSRIYPVSTPFCPCNMFKRDPFLRY